MPNTVQETTKATAEGIRDVSDAMDRFSNAGFKNSNILKDMNDSFRSVKEAGYDFINVLDKLNSPTFITESLRSITGTFSNIVTGTYEAVKGYDALDSGLRTFAKDQFQLAAGIGRTFEESEKFAKSYRGIIEANSELGREGLYIGSQDIKNTIATLQKAGVSVEDLAEKSGVAIGKNKEFQLSYAQTMAAQAEAMGMTVETYSGKMAAMVRKSGLSMEDSMKLMAASQDIARNTGLTVDEVTASLEGATSSFQKMGTTMDFGRPILKGFADSLKEVGLGVAQAGDLTSAFSQSLSKIVDSPALAYMTSLKGGFGAAAGGTGGILAPSIQMQAQMMDQTPGSQAELARNLSEGMRETLKSFTGGDIITVKEAAASPDLSTQFYTQQKMLGSTYGISDSATQNRVLEYLSQLEEATYAGDEDTVDMLNKQIQEATTSNDKTMSLQEKMSQDIEKSKMLIDEQVQIMKLNLKADFEKTNAGDEWRKTLNLLDQVGGVRGTGATDSKTQEESYKKLQELLTQVKTPNAPEVPPPAGAEMSKTTVSQPQTQIQYVAAPPVNQTIILENRTGIDLTARSGPTTAGVPEVK